MLRRIQGFIVSSSVLLSLILLNACQAQHRIAEENPNMPTPVNQDRHVTLLQQKLPLYQAAVLHPWPTLPMPNSLIRFGDQSDEIILIRERLAATQDLNERDVDNDIFDRALVNAVKKFQWRNGLKPDGIIGNDTIEAMNVPPEVRLKEIELNIKRWQDLSEKAHNRYILVNIPEFQLHLYDQGKEAFSMKVVVGRPTRQTPELESKITRLELNPYWNVPDLIANKDIVPKAVDDPQYLSSENIHIYADQDAYENEISPSQIDWAKAKMDGFPYHFRQAPGEKNALGLVRFEFANTHDVYLHDTPAKELFASDVRDYSSGCVRLEKPFNLVSYLIEHDPDMTMQKVQSIVQSQKNTYYTIKNPIPIYITYITSWVDDQGNLHFAKDLYGRDS